MVRRPIALCVVLLWACSPDAAGVGGGGTAEPNATSTGTGESSAGETTSSTDPVAPDGTSSGGEPDGTSTGPGSTGDPTTGSTSSTTDGADTEPQPQEVEYCTVANLPIPDANVEGVSSPINVDLFGGGTIVSMELVIQATHSYVGDLRFDLRKDDASIIVINQPGGGTCSGNDIDVVLRDDGSGPVETSCLDDGRGYPGLGGELVPETPFDPEFTGDELVGTWRLRAIDRAEQDAGTLQAWCLRFTYW